MSGERDKYSFSGNFSLSGAILSPRAQLNRANMTTVSSLAKDEPGVQRT